MYPFPYVFIIVSVGISEKSIALNAQNHGSNLVEHTKKLLWKTWPNTRRAKIMVETQSNRTPRFSQNVENILKIKKWGFL